MKNAVHDLRSDLVLRVDLKGVRSKKALLVALATGLKLPKHFGHNWDALADCLMDSDWARHDSTTILLSGAGNAEKRFSEDWDTLLEVFDETCVWWGEHNKSFRVVLA
jgi:RNAse (barnase) inhibitor barstar